MKLINMKRPKKSKKDMEQAMAPEIAEEDERYPWGLRVSFDTEEVKKIPGLKDMEVGTQVNFQAKGKVINVRTEERRDGTKSHHVEIQLEQVNVKDASAFGESFKEAGKR